mgnify:CR=1 FL=1
MKKETKSKMAQNNKAFFAMLRGEKIRARNVGLRLNSLAEKVNLDEEYDKIGDAEEIAETPAMEYLIKYGAGV